MTGKATTAMTTPTHTPNTIDCPCDCHADNGHCTACCDPAYNETCPDCRYHLTSPHGSHIGGARDKGQRPLDNPRMTVRATREWSALLAAVDHLDGAGKP